MSQLIDGVAIARALTERVAGEVASLQTQGVTPALAVILVGEDPASAVYVRRKVAQCRRVGVRSIEHRLEADSLEAVVLDLIDALNADPEVHGVLVQLPLPRSIEVGKVLNRIAPAKDVDGFHPSTSGACSRGRAV